MSDTAFVAAITATRLRRDPSKGTGRCVHCSSLKDQHGPDGTCPGLFTQYATMALEDGKTCADCIHVERCCKIFGQLPDDKTCQFYPSRFFPIAAVERP